MGRSSQSRAKLLDAMVGLMWSRSYGSLTIDLICETAQVKKGSFYYFFDSKVALAIAAMDHIWEYLQPKLDEMFSPSKPPLKRLLSITEHAYLKTKEVAQKEGRVLGCPYFNIGAEISTLEPQLAERVNSLLARYVRYFETAIRDAHAEGSVPDMDTDEAARIVFNLYEGMLTQARMKNDPEVLRDLPVATARILKIESLA